MFIQNYELAPVKSAKVLGIHLSTDLKWDLHIAHIVAKGQSGYTIFDYLKVLGSTRTPYLVTVYTTCLRSVLEYGCQVWHYDAKNYLCEEVERIQKTENLPDYLSRPFIQRGLVSILPASTKPKTGCPLPAVFPKNVKPWS